LFFILPAESPLPPATPFNKGGKLQFALGAAEQRPKQTKFPPLLKGVCRRQGGFCTQYYSQRLNKEYFFFSNSHWYVLD